MHVSKKEQVSVATRYLHSGFALEELLNFTPASRLDAKSLLKMIKKALGRCNTDHLHCAVL